MSRQSILMNTTSNTHEPSINHKPVDKPLNKGLHLVNDIFTECAHEHSIKIKGQDVQHRAFPYWWILLLISL